GKWKANWTAHCGARRSGMNNRFPLEETRHRPRFSFTRQREVHPLPHTRIHAFLPAIRTLNPIRPLTKHDLLTEPFLIDRSGDLDMYYAPHNEYINTKAKIVLIGITPGWQQMQRAFEQAVKSLSLGHSLEQVLKETK